MENIKIGQVLSEAAQKKEFRSAEVFRFARRVDEAERATVVIAFCRGILPERRGNLFKSRHARLDHKATRFFCRFSRREERIGIIESRGNFRFHLNLFETTPAGPPRESIKLSENFP